MIHLLVPVATLIPLVGEGHFFGPPAVGFGVGLVSYHRGFRVAPSIVSRRSSRSYSHQTFFRATPWGTQGYSTSTTTYTYSDHYYSRNHLAYYQPNVFRYHSTPWTYRWGRSADIEARERREAKLTQIGDISRIPLNKISDVASNVSIAYSPEVWDNDMIYKDQDDCSKRLLCELNAKSARGQALTESESLIADAFGKDNDLNVGAETLEFDIAAVLGRKVGQQRCELSYRRCEIKVKDMIKMINVEVEEIETIQKELDAGAISLSDIDNRLDEEDQELDRISPDELARATTTTTTTPAPQPSGKLPLLLG